MIKVKLRNAIVTFRRYSQGYSGTVFIEHCSAVHNLNTTYVHNVSLFSHIRPKSVIKILLALGLDQYFMD